LAKFHVGILGAVTPAKRFDDPDNLSPFLESRLDERFINEIGHQRIAGNEHMAPRHEGGHDRRRQPTEENAQGLQVTISQYGKSWQRAPLAPIKGWWQSPNPTIAIFPLAELTLGVFYQAIGRVCDNGMD